MPKATDDTCLSDLSSQMGTDHMPSEKPGNVFWGPKNAAKVAGKVRSIAPSNHPKWLEP